jgi:hypothetical protein
MNIDQPNAQFIDETICNRFFMKKGIEKYELIPISEKTKKINSISLYMILKENIPILSLVGIYVLSGYTLQLFDNLSEMMHMRFISITLIKIAAFFSVLFLIVQILRGKTWQYINTQSISGFIIILLLLVPFQSTFSSIKQIIPLINKYSWDTSLMRLDYFLHFGRHPWEILEIFINSERLLRAIDILYMFWFIFLFIFCCWMAWSSDRKLRLQYFISSLLVWILLGSIFGTIFSSVGPCYYQNVIEINDAVNPYQNLLGKLEIYHENKALWAIFNQIGLWNSQATHNWLPFGGISAMPSIHVAMAIIFLLTSFKVNKWLGILFAIYALAVQIGSVVLGWHYAVDGYFGAVATVIIWVFIGNLLERYNKYILQ